MMDVMEVERDLVGTGPLSLIKVPLAVMIPRGTRILYYIRPRCSLNNIRRAYIRK
jgi:hypothetical protein